MDHAAALGLDPEEMESLRDRLETASFEGREYESLSSERRGVERGTVLFEECVVRGYPSTPRALVAAPAIRERFEGRVHVEEKLNGYDVLLPDETRDCERVVEAVELAAATRDKVDYYTDAGTDDE